MKALMLDFDDMLYLTPSVLVTWWYYARYGYLMRENMLCAGEEGKDSCSGDQVCLYCTIATFFLTMYDHQIGLQVTAEVPWSVLLERRGVWCWLEWLLGARVVEGKKRGLWKVLAYKVGCKGELWCRNGPILSNVDNYCKWSRLLQVMDNYCPAAWYHIWLRSWQGNYNRGPFVPDGRLPLLSLSFSLIQQVFMAFF